MRTSELVHFEADSLQASHGRNGRLPAHVEEFWPVVGYDSVDTASELVLTLLDGCQIKLTKAEVRHFRGFELRTVVEEYTKKLSNALQSTHGGTYAVNLIQGLLNEVTAFASCVVDWNPKMYLADKDRAAQVDWRTMLENVGLSAIQKVELLHQRCTYLSKGADDETHANQRAATTSVPSNIDSSICAQNRRHCAFNNYILLKVLSPQQAAKVFVASTPWYPDIVCMADVLQAQQPSASHSPKSVLETLRCKQSQPDLHRQGRASGNETLHRPSSLPIKLYEKDGPRPFTARTSLSSQSAVRGICSLRSIHLLSRRSMGEIEVKRRVQKWVPERMSYTEICDEIQRGTHADLTMHGLQTSEEAVFDFPESSIETAAMPDLDGEQQGGPEGWMAAAKRSENIWTTLGDFRNLLQNIK
eukprot:jgi/Botrbrau1/10125/Bobra.20_2s0030.2